MAKTKEKRQKKKGRSTQELIGVKSFTKYGLETQKGELLFYLVGPTNISVLSRVNIEIKIRHLMMVLSAIPDIEIACTDSCECFDDNKSYLQERMDEEQNPKDSEKGYGDAGPCTGRDVHGQAVPVYPAV